MADSKDIPNTRTMKKDTRYWFLKSDDLKEKFWLPRMRCPKCGHAYQGATDDVKDAQGTRTREFYCVACHTRFDKPVLRKKYPTSQRACPHCASLKICQFVNVIHKSKAEWDGYGYHDVDTDIDTAYGDYDTQELHEGVCDWCEKEFNWNQAPRANDGLRENPKSYASLLHRTKGLLARLIESKNENETECEQLIAMIENRLAFDEEEK